MAAGTIAVVGGTGHLGAAIAWRLARAGRDVIIGSRKAEAAQDKAAELGHGLRGMANAEAAAAAELIIVTVPFAAQEATLADAMGLRGLHGGALVNSAAAEALTSILIFLNKNYKVDGAGIRITGELVSPLD
jgi:predicted dinucleotide-binding enzyme